ncbi:L-type lectin-domain containing receptor kinase IX.1-like [Syzygium oleosum]|uniref:L-type lectin-domain containing receptor kinase IX.1-like n=1 Tax=Syzygium oleosum TaxID=219896 RepID=UPI0024BA9668|nr:L-type lectin-domain containing receptor kinase IX.1-like [Syzygium oleosum]
MEEELTLTGLLKKAASDFPDRRAVSARGEFEFDLTHAWLQELVDHATALLAAYDIGPSDVVALAFPNTVEFVILFLAVIRCRAAAAPLDPAYKAAEFGYYLSHLQSKLLLTPNEGNRLAHSAASKLNTPHLTAKLHSADSKIALSSTDIEPDLDLMSKVINDPSDVALYLYDCDIPGHNFLELALYLHNRNIPAFRQRVQFTQKELSTVLSKKRKYAKSPYSAVNPVIKDPLLHYRRIVLDLLSSLAAGTAVALPAATAAARSSVSRFLDKMMSGNATRHTAVVGPGVRYRPEVARPDLPEGNNAPTTTDENKTETERGGEEPTLTEELANLGGTKKFSYEELRIATNYFASDQKLGEGGFGIVYKGHIGEDRTPVAVKKITSGARQGITEYKSEVKSLSQLRHRNLVRLLGCCHEANKFVLVYEFVGGGSLYYHLFEGGPLLTWTRRYNIAQGLASALYYLQKQGHQCVIHRDIKSNNVMLDEKFEAKLGDFGLAKLVDHTRDPSTTLVKGTLGYLAPEYFRTGKASKESDIYGFGVVLLEIFCGRRASDSELAEQGGLVHWAWKRCGCGSRQGGWFQNFQLPVDEKLGNDFDKKQAEALMILGLLCAHPIASSRPSIEKVMAVLNLTAEPPKLPSKMPSFNV